MEEVTLSKAGPPVCNTIPATTSTPTPVVAPPRSLRWTIRSLSVVIVVSLVGGIAAALVGGSLTELGSGAGGLFGIPSILTTAIALFVAIPAAVAISRRALHFPGWLRAAIVIGGGAWLVAIGYFVVAHAVDPCANGWWDARSRLGDQPLCERFGPALNWHTRYHLLAHAAPASVILGAYLWAIRRWGRPDVSAGRVVSEPPAE
jgi:hypothetical protein